MCVREASGNSREELELKFNFPYSPVIVICQVKESPDRKKTGNEVVNSAL